MRRFFLITCCAISVAAVVILLMAALLLPAAIEQRIFPWIVARSIAGKSTGEVRSVGLRRLDLGNIVIGSDNTDTISIGSIQLDYSLAALWSHRQLAGLTIHNLSIRAGYDNGRLLLPGIDLQKIAAGAGDETAGAELPLSIGRVVVQGGWLRLDYAGQAYLLPFDLEIVPVADATAKKGAVTAYRSVLTLFPGGAPVRFAGEFDLVGGSGQLEFAAASFSLERYADFFQLLPGFSAAGHSRFNGRAAFQFSPFQLDSFSLAWQLDSGFLGIPPIRLGPSFDADGNMRPARLSLTGSPESVRLELVDFGTTAPLPGRLDLQAEFQKRDTRLDGSGFLKIVLGPEEGDPGRNTGLWLKEAMPVAGGFTFDADDQGRWNFHFDSVADKTVKAAPSGWRLVHNSGILAGAAPEISVSGQGVKSLGVVTATVRVPNFTTTSGSVAAAVPVLSAKAAVDFDQTENSGLAGIAKIEALLKKTSVHSPEFDVTGDYELRTELKTGVPGPDSDNGVQAAGLIRAVNTTITAAGPGLRADGVAAELPWDWPPPSAGSKPSSGLLSAAAIRVKGRDLGGVSIKVGQEPTGISLQFDGIHQSRLLPGVVLQLSGSGGIVDGTPTAQLQFAIPPTLLAGINLGQYVESAHGTYLDGEIAMTGQAGFSNGVLNSNAVIEFADGRIDNYDRNLAIENIRGKLALPDLVRLYSEPSQSLEFDRLALGKLQLTKGRILFRLESPTSFFIEKSEVQWAGGRLFTPSIRFSAGRAEYDLTLFCDRLRLADVLAQFGVPYAEGGGAVNGRLPVRYRDGRIFFDNGFLYSSPGEGGTVRISAAELLTAGIPKGTPQFSQIDFAAEALKNFQYKWVKLLFNSEEDEVVLQMQLDGEPEYRLPFVYQGETGSFVRVETGSGAGIDQPIRLDVNFRFPLNTFLGYSGKIQGVIDKMK